MQYTTTLSPEEIAIYDHLKRDPLTFRTSGDGNRMYILIGEGVSEVMYRFDREEGDKNFNDQTFDELRKRLADFMLDAMNELKI